jgi:HD-like signal output (HDOD) protein
MESLKDFENKVTEFIHRFPPMPGNVGELLDAVNVQQMGDEELLEYVKQDPGLCADLLHLANTFSIRPEGHDDTTEEAVNSVGIKPPMLPGELLTKLKLTPEGFIKTQQIYFARIAEN